MIAVVGVLIAACDLVHALANQLAHMMMDMCLTSPINYAGNQPLGQTDVTVNFPQVQNSCIRTHARIIKKGGNFFALKGCKFKLKCGNYSRVDILPSFNNSLFRKELRIIHSFFDE